LKPILLLIVIALISTLQQQQTVEGEDPGLKVVKFSWAKDVQKTRMIRMLKNVSPTIFGSCW